MGEDFSHTFATGAMPSSSLSVPGTMRLDVLSAVIQLCSELDGQTMTSGDRPNPRNSLTPCCVGLVFCSPTAPRTGTSETVTLSNGVVMPALGLGTPLSMALKAGDALWMDYRCFHHGGANRSDELRAVLYATFSEDREEGEGAETMDAEAGHGDHTSFSMAPREQCHCLSEYLGARL